MASTAYGVIAQSNTSTYIVAGVDTYASPQSDGTYLVECYLYYRRTNTYSGVTYSSSTDGTITIDGTSTSGNFAAQIPGNTNAWQGPYLYASKKVSPGSTVSIAWSTTDYAGAYFGGEGSESISIPSGPSGLTIGSPTNTPTSVKATVSVSAWGSGGTTAGHYLELSVCQSQSTSTRNYKRVFTGAGTASTITVDNSDSMTGKGLTIAANSKYYITGAASNGDIKIGNSSYTTTYTPHDTPTISVSDTTDTSTKLTFSFSRGGSALYSTFWYHYKPTGGSFSNWAHATVNQTTGTITLTGLSPSTEYLIDTCVIGSVNSSGSDTTTESVHKTLTFTTQEEPVKAYASLNGEAARVTKVYAGKKTTPLAIQSTAHLVKKIYDSHNGVTRRIY